MSYSLLNLALGGRWCWTMLVWGGGRSRPPSDWDNTPLSALCWNRVLDVCLPWEGGDSKSGAKVTVTLSLLTSHLKRAGSRKQRGAAASVSQRQHFCASSRTQNAKGNSCVDSSEKAWQQNPTAAVPPAHFLARNVAVKGHSCSSELITRQDKLRKG